MFLLGRLSAARLHVLTMLMIFSLSSGVLGGILLYMDSTGPIIMSDMMSERPLHLEIAFSHEFYLQSQVTEASILDEIRKQDGIGAAEVVTIADITNRYLDNESHSRYAYLGVEPSFFTSFEDMVQLSDNSLPLDGTGCYLEEGFLLDLELDIGDDVELWAATEYIYPSVFMHMTVLGSFRCSGPWGQTSVDTKQVSILRMITSRTVLESVFAVMELGSAAGLNYAVWARVDSALLMKLEPSEAVNAVNRAIMRIEQACIPLAEVEKTPVLDAVAAYSAWSWSMRSLAIAFSIPSIVMGVMLVQYSSELLADDRRREVGTMRVRGSSGWQAFSWVLGFALVTASIGSIGAVLMGLLAALLSASVEGFVEFNLQNLTGFSLVLSPAAVAIVFGFSFSVGTLVALPAAAKALLISPSDAHSTIERQPLLGAQSTGNPVAMAAVAAVTGLLVIVLYSSAGSGGAIEGGLVMTLTRILVLGAFILSLAVLLSSPAAALKSWVLQRVRHRSMLVGARVVGRTCATYHRRESLGVMFMTMVFIAGVFSAVSANTGYQHLRGLIWFEDGADIVLDVSPDAEETIWYGLESIEAVDGVQSVAAMMRYVSRVLYWNVGPYHSQKVDNTIVVFGVQPEEWAQAAFLLPYFTKIREPTENLMLIDGQANLTISSFRPISGYTLTEGSGYVPIYGDTVSLLLNSDSGASYANLTIVDVMSVDETRESVCYMPGSPYSDNFLIVDLDMLHDRLSTYEVNRLYVKIRPGADYREVRESILDVAPEAFSYVKCPQERLDATMTSKAVQAIFGVYSLNAVFSTIYLTVGIALLSVEKERRSRKDFAVLRAMGTAYPPITASVLYDTMIGIALAAALGCGVGYLLSRLVLATPLMYSSSATALSWARLPVIVEPPLAFLLQFVAVSFILPLIATYAVVRWGLRTRIADELRSSE